MPMTQPTTLSPAPVEPAKPLSREAVRELLDAAGYTKAQEKADFINGLRHGEIAHGIQGAKG